MTYYQAYCSRGDFESNLFIKEANAYRSARAHMRATGHKQVDVRLIYIDNLNVTQTKRVN